MLFRGKFFIFSFLLLVIIVSVDYQELSLLDGNPLNDILEFYSIWKVKIRLFVDYPDVDYRYEKYRLLYLYLYFVKTYVATSSNPVDLSVSFFTSYITVSDLKAKQASLLLSFDMTLNRLKFPSSDGYSGY